MKIFTKFNQTFGFTQMESRVVLFLILAFVIGIGIKVYKSKYSIKPPYNYSAMDSEFTARSQSIEKNDSSESDDSDAIGDKNKLKSNISKTKVTDNPTPKLDINKASKEEFVKLPGIGETMADRIILYRNENGRFTIIEQLTKVKGIGKKKFERIAPYIMVGK